MRCTCGNDTNAADSICIICVFDQEPYLENLYFLANLERPEKYIKADAFVSVSNVRG